MISVSTHLFHNIMLKKRIETKRQFSTDLFNAMTVSIQESKISIRIEILIVTVTVFNNLFTEKV